MRARARAPAEAVVVFARVFQGNQDRRVFKRGSPGYAGLVEISYPIGRARDRFIRRGRVADAHTLSAWRLVCVVASSCRACMRDRVRSLRAICICTCMCVCVCVRMCVRVRVRVHEAREQDSRVRTGEKGTKCPKTQPGHLQPLSLNSCGTATAASIFHISDNI